MSLSVVIPHRGNSLGLWATVTSCSVDLAPTKLDYDFIIVTNGEKLGADALNVIEHLRREKKLGHHHHTDEPLTAQHAREIGARLSDKDTLFFLDNHCLLEPGYFQRATDAMAGYNIQMLHSTTVYYAGTRKEYHYNLTLDKNFWAGSSSCPESTWKPYKIAAGGHGGFAIDRNLFLSVDGYGPSELFTGYAGEELSFDLKLWRLGHEVWLDPKMIHYHFAGSRGYPRHYSDDYYRNLLVSAKLIGGQKWIDKLFLNFVTRATPRFGPKLEWFDIYEQADNKAAQYAAKIDEHSKYTLDELLYKFRVEQIAH